MMSCMRAGMPLVSTSIRWAHDLGSVSPGGVHSADAALQRLLSRQMASSIRRSPESIHGGGPRLFSSEPLSIMQFPAPAVREGGGLFWGRMGRSATPASMTLPSSGVPVITMTFKEWSETKLKVVRY